MYVVGVDFTAPQHQLPANGRTIVAAATRGQPAGSVDVWAPYAAQSMDVLLAAIGRSDGTRASVAGALFRVHVRNGVLGSFNFTRQGDPSRGIVLAYRVIPQSPGTRPVMVIRVPASAN